MIFDDLLCIRKGSADLTLGYRPSRIEKIITADEWKSKAEALREIFRQTLGESSAVSSPLLPQIIEEAECKDHIRRKVAYSLEPDERICAYVLIPRNISGKSPAVICIHQTTPLGKEQTIGNDPSEEGQDYACALHLVRRGYITLAYDLLSAGERCYPGLKAFDTEPFYKKHPKWSVRGKDLWDATRAIDLLYTMKEVDTARIGSVGHSQGGGITIHAMALDERIKAGVSSCGLCPARISKNPFGEARTGWWVGRPFLRPYCLAGKQFPIDLHEYLAMIAPRAIFVSSALNDFMYVPEEEGIIRPAFENMAENVEKVFDLLGAGGNFRMLLHAKGHGFIREQREAAYAFLDEKLKKSSLSMKKS